MAHVDALRSLNVSVNDDFHDIDFYSTRQAAMVLRALNHQIRQQIIKTIRENKRLTVTQLYIKLRLAQSVTSQHLAILRGAAIVSVERSGKLMYYSINYSRISAISEFAKNITW